MVMNVTVVQSSKKDYDYFALLRTGSRKLLTIKTGKTELLPGSRWRLRIDAGGGRHIEMRPNDLRRLRDMVKTKIASLPVDADKPEPEV
jgi:hypothetical protein